MSYLHMGAFVRWAMQLLSVTVQRICTCIYSHVTAEMAGWFMENL